MKRSTYIVLGVIAIIVVYFWSSYNGLISTNESVDTQWAQVETQYQRRFDLIPNLVESVKGIMAQEQAVFGALAEARSRYAGATNNNDKARAAGELEGALSRLLVVMEAYPQLKSSENVLSLQNELAGTENRVSVERKRYNDAVRNYNLNVKRFPKNLIASLFGFGEKTYFESVEGSENAPKVDF